MKNIIVKLAPRNQKQVAWTVVCYRFLSAIIRGFLIVSNAQSVSSNGGLKIAAFEARNFDEEGFRFLLFVYG